MALKPEPAVSNAPRPLTKKVEAMKAGDFVFTSGQLAHDARNGVPPEAAGPAGRADLAKQTAYTIRNMTQSIGAAGASPRQDIKGQALLLDAGQPSGFRPPGATHLPTIPRYPRSASAHCLSAVRRLEVDKTAYLLARTFASHPASLRLAQRPSDAAALSSPAASMQGSIWAICHRSASCRYLTRTTVCDPPPDRMGVDRLDIASRDVGSSLDHVAKAQVFPTDLADFAVFDEVWREHFKVAPARSVVRTSGLPVDGARIAIEVYVVMA